MRRIHDVPEKGTLQFLLNAFLGAYNRRTDVMARQASGGDAQKLDAIIDMLRSSANVPGDVGLMKEELSTIHELIFQLQQFNGKVEEFMATQEERLRNVQTGLQSVAEGVNTLQQQIADLKANNPELEDEIGALETTVKAIADDINGVVPGGTEGGGTEG